MLANLEAVGVGGAALSWFIKITLLDRNCINTIIRNSFSTSRIKEATRLSCLCYFFSCYYKLLTTKIHGSISAIADDTALFFSYQNEDQIGKKSNMIFYY